MIDDPAQPEINSTLQPLRCYWLCAACDEAARWPMKSFITQGRLSVFEDRSFMTPFAAPFMDPLTDQEQPVFEERGLEARAGEGVAL